MAWPMGMPLPTPMLPWLTLKRVRLVKGRSRSDQSYIRRSSRNVPTHIIAALAGCL